MTSPKEQRWDFENKLWMKCLVEKLSAIFEKYPNMKIAFGMDNADFTVLYSAAFRELMDSLVAYALFLMDIGTRFSRKADSVPRHSSVHLCLEECADGGGF